MNNEAIQEMKQEAQISELEKRDLDKSFFDRRIEAEKRKESVNERLSQYDAQRKKELEAEKLNKLKQAQLRQEEINKHQQAIKEVETKKYFK